MAWRSTARSVRGRRSSHTRSTGSTARWTRSARRSMRGTTSEPMRPATFCAPSSIDMMRLTRIATLVAAVLGVTHPAAAQVRASERGSVSQMVDGTTIAVNYGRPQLRGRTPFPDVVHWGEMWTPGANWATTFEVDRPVRFGGQPVAAGTYTMWAVPGEKEWTVHLHRNARLFHMAQPPASQMLLGVPVTPQTSEPTEILTFDFVEVHPTSTTMQFRWGKVAIRVPIEVEPMPDGSLFTPAEAAPFLGKYTMLSA